MIVTEKIETLFEIVFHFSITHGNSLFPFNIKLQNQLYHILGIYHV